MCDRADYQFDILFSSSDTRGSIKFPIRVPVRFNKNFSIVKSHTPATLTWVNSNECHQKKRLSTNRDGQLFIDIATEKQKQIFPGKD